MKYELTNETDKQLLSLMTHVQAFLKGRLTLSELGEAEERAEIFRTNQVTNYDEVAERVNAAQIERENAELLEEIYHLEAAIHDGDMLMAKLRKDRERLDWLIDYAYIQFYKVDDGGEWEMELDASDARNHIDREMEEYKQ